MIDPALTLAHVGHWYWQLLMVAPLLIGAVILFVAEARARREPDRYSVEAEREQADRELDDILDS